MSSEQISIRVRNISKCFEMYEKPVYRLYQTIFAGHKKFFKEFWALRDVDFEVKKGECIGIIGRNGAGKSTLLQIITGTLQPTSGDVEVNGRIAALLELGSGFNPEFTGKENVYLNGTILGLSKAEIDRKYHEIISFADIGDFIHQPVKTYSSGMKVRLAFAVQVVTDPDVLIVDEALAVGDAAFQIKCMTHMKNLLARGVTVVFVSHSVQTIRTFCDRCIWLQKGRVKMAGNVKEVTSRYMEHLFAASSPAEKCIQDKAEHLESPVKEGAKKIPLMPVAAGKRNQAELIRWGEGYLQLQRFALWGDKNDRSMLFEHGDKIHIVLESKVIDLPPEAEKFCMGFALRDKRGIDVIAVGLAERQIFIPVKEVGQIARVSFSFRNILLPGEYMLIGAIQFFNANGERFYFDYVENMCLFTVVSDRKHNGVVEPEVEVKVN